MNTLLRLLLILSVGVVLPARVAAADDVPNRTPEEIEKLVSPIALYPDSLVALILPASTESSDVVLAARFLSFGGKESDIEKQFWHESVKALAHYPEIVRWMDENLEWMQQLGGVFAGQPADVMTAIQRLRADARARGLLADTPQQRVVVEHEVVYIVPSNPSYIHIPRYDPEVLWMRRPWHGSFISFSMGFGVGNWLFYDCDWPGRTIWVHRRHPGWVYRPFWRPPPPAARVHVVTAWKPAPHMHHRNHDRPGHRGPTVVVVPRYRDDERRAGHDRRDDHRGREHDFGRTRMPPVRPVAPGYPRVVDGGVHRPGGMPPPAARVDDRSSPPGGRMGPPPAPTSGREGHRGMNPGEVRPERGPDTPSAHGHRPAPRVPGKPASGRDRPPAPPTVSNPRPAAPVPANSVPATNENRENPENRNHDSRRLHRGH